MKSLVIISVLILICGCSKEVVEYKIDVKSNTAWSGYFDNRTVDGVINKRIDVGNEPPVCCSCQKETENGYLKLTVIKIVKKEPRGLAALFGENEINEYKGTSARTDAAYGVVLICTHE